MQTRPNSIQPILDHLRAAGLSVAIHNDYSVDGRAFTSWLMTNKNSAFKGEGSTDMEALLKIAGALSEATGVQVAFDLAGSRCWCWRGA
jgi:hypothetical protein